MVHFSQDRHNTSFMPSALIPILVRFTAICRVGHPPTVMSFEQKFCSCQICKYLVGHYIVAVPNLPTSATILKQSILALLLM